MNGSASKNEPPSRYRQHENHGNEYPPESAHRYGFLPGLVSHDNGVRRIGLRFFQYARRVVSVRNDGEMREAPNLPPAPPETTFFFRKRIVDPIHIPGTCEEILVNERVVLRKEYAESRMRMIPAYNPLAREPVSSFFMNSDPGLLREGYVCASVRRALSWNRPNNLYAGVGQLADQRPADFHLRRSVCMLTNRLENGRVNSDRLVFALGRFALMLFVSRRHVQTFPYRENPPSTSA